MKPLLNALGLPEAFVRAAAFDDYDNEGSFLTASAMADPPQIRHLVEKHADVLPPEDAMDRVYVVGGQAMHVVLERAARAIFDVTEKRLSATVLGEKVSAKIDLYEPDTRTLTNWKETSAWTLVYKSRLDDWTKQLNVEAELATLNEYPVSKIQVVARLRDWSKTDAQRSPDYPKTPVVVVPLELWPQEKRAAYIHERVAVYLAAREGNVQPCTDEERWAKPVKYAVMKQGRKSAVKLCDTEADAFSLAQQQGAGAWVQRRPGGYARCEGGYCRAASVCQQFAADRAEKEAAA